MQTLSLDGEEDGDNENRQDGGMRIIEDEIGIVRSSGNLGQRDEKEEDENGEFPEKIRLPSHPSSPFKTAN